MSHFRSNSLNSDKRKLTGEALRINIANRIKLMQKSLKPTNSSLTAKVALHNIDKAKRDFNLRKKEFENNISKDLDKVNSNLSESYSYHHRRTPSELESQMNNLDNNRPRFSKPRSSTVYPKKRINPHRSTYDQLQSFSERSQNHTKNDYSVNICRKLHENSNILLRSFYKPDSANKIRRKRLESCESLRVYCDEVTRSDNPQSHNSLIGIRDLENVKSYVHDIEDSLNVDSFDDNRENMQNVKIYNKHSYEKMKKSGKSIKKEADGITTYVSGLGKKTI